MARNETFDVTVLGGGIVGLALAWRARARGLSVLVVERDRVGRGASRVAAGMLAPVSEVEFGPHGERALELGLRSARMWPAFAAELERAAGMEVGLRGSGILTLARDDDEARELERQLEFRRSLGLAAVRLRASEAREREPALQPTVRLALEAPDDHSVDPRRVVAALCEACERAGVRIHEGVGSARVAMDDTGERVRGVELEEDGWACGADRVVVATGAWSGRVDGLPERAGVPVRPVKGQIMLLADPAGPGLVSRPVRYRGGYVVPRGDGRYVLGATVEERGFQTNPTVGGAYQLLRDAHELLPGVSELDILELNVGYRPGTPDNVPILGPGAVEGLVWATGHYRNGILLAPLTAELLVKQLVGAALDEDEQELLRACAPGRFARARGEAVAS